MSTGIIDWIRAVLLVSFLATLVSLLLPDNTLRPFVRLVTGLVLLSVLIQPLLMFVGTEAAWEELQWESALGSAPPTVQVSLASGEAVRERGRQAVVDQVQMYVQGQVEAIVSLAPGVDEVSVAELRLDEAGIHGIVLHLRGRDEAEGKVRDLLSKFFAIDPALVTIWWLEEGE